MNKKIAMIAVSFLIMTSSLVAASTQNVFLDTETETIAVPQAVENRAHPIHDSLYVNGVSMSGRDGGYLEVGVGNRGRDVLTNVKIVLTSSEITYLGETKETGTGTVETFEMGTIDTLYPDTLVRLQIHFPENMYEEIGSVHVYSDEGASDVLYMHNYPEPDRDLYKRIEELENRVRNNENIITDIIRMIQEFFYGPGHVETY